MRGGGIKVFLSVLVVVASTLTTTIYSGPVALAEPGAESNTSNTVVETNIDNLPEQSEADNADDNSNSTEPSTETNDQQDSPETTESCESGLLGFGWIICPGQNLITMLISWMMGLIDGALNWTLLANNPDQLQVIWRNFLNIANIAFAIAFLVMIYSMATSTGLSNYDIKKMLPRLIIVAIAVNLSFYICAALVDLSNIAGKGVYKLITSQMTAGGGLEMWVGNITSSLLGVGVLAVAGFLMGGVIVVAILTILLALTFRNLALVVLVAISPVAMVLYTLPNTEQWGKQWFNYFTRMLIVYPMFTAVWGAAQLVSWITAKVGGGIPIITDVACAIAPAVAIIPIFKSTGGLMKMFTGGVQGSSAAKSVGKFTQGAIDHSKPTLAARQLAGKVALGAQNKFGDTRVVGAILRKPGYNKLVNNATDLEASIDKGAMESSSNWVKGLSGSQLSSLVTTGSYKDGKKDIHIVDTYKLRGAINAAKSSLDAKDWGNVMRTMNSRAATLKSAGREKEAAQLMASVRDAAFSEKSAVVGGGFIAKLGSNAIAPADFDKQYRSAVAGYASELTRSKLADLSDSTQTYMMGEINHALEDARNTGDTDTATKLEKQVSSYQATARELLGDSKLASKLTSKSRRSLELAEHLGDTRNTVQRQWADSLNINEAVNYYRSDDRQEVQCAIDHAEKVLQQPDLSGLHPNDRTAIDKIKQHGHDNNVDIPVITWSK